MINMPITDIMTLIGGEVEKPAAEPVGGEDISASFLDVMAADIAMPENVVDGQVVVPVVTRVLPQVLQIDIPEPPAVQVAPLPDGSIDQPAFAQYADQRLSVMAKTGLSTHSGTPDMQPVLQVEDTDRIPVRYSVLPDNKMEAEKPRLLAVHDPKAVPHKKEQIAPDDFAAVKSVPPESIQKGVLETVVTPEQPKQIQPKPETGLQLAGVEIGKGQDTAPRQSQRPIARAKDAAPIGAQTPLPAQDLPKPAPIDTAPKDKSTVIAPPQMNEARPALPAATPLTPAPGLSFESRPELPRAPEVLPTQIAPASQPSKISAPDAPPVEAPFLNRPDRPQPAAAPIAPQPIPTPPATPVNHPQPLGAPMALSRDPALPASQPLLAQVINSPAPFQPKEVKIAPPQNVQIAAPPPNSVPPKPTLPNAPTPPLPAVETALPDMVEPLEAPDLFPVETRPTDSTGTRLDTITTRPEVARHVAQQLAEVARQMPDRPIELALNPEELGRVRLTFTMTDGGISVAVITERGETMDLLRRHIDTLAQEFRDMGYKDVNFEFFRNGQGNTGDGDTNHDHNANSDGPPIETEALAPVQLSLEPLTGLDLRL